MIDVLPRAAQLAGEPCHGALLAGEFFFDKVSDMWSFVRGHGFEIWAYKKRGNYSLFEHRVSTPTHLTSHSTPYRNTALDNLSLMRCPSKKALWKLVLKNQLQTLFYAIEFAIICLDLYYY